MMAVPIKLFAMHGVNSCSANPGETMFVAILDYEVSCHQFLKLFIDLCEPHILCSNPTCLPVPSYLPSTHTYTHTCVCTCVCVKHVVIYLMYETNYQNIANQDKSRFLHEENLVRGLVRLLIR